jgi:hypothetical protein
MVRASAGMRGGAVTCWAPIVTVAERKDNSGYLYRHGGVSYGSRATRHARALEISGTFRHVSYVCDVNSFSAERAVSPLDGSELWVVLDPELVPHIDWAGDSVILLSTFSLLSDRVAISSGARGELWFPAAAGCVVFLSFGFVIMSLFSSRGWES